MRHLGLWSEAFPLSRESSRSGVGGRLRADDVVETADLVKTLRTALYREALGDPDKVLTLFADGCRELLGFHEVTRWRNGSAWRPEPGGCFDAPGALEPGYLRFSRLPRAGRFAGRLSWTISRRSASRPAAAESLRRRRDVVIVGRPDQATILLAPAPRMHQLADDLVDAYSHALNAKRVRELLKTREVYTSIVNKILASLGGDVFKVRQVLEMAAESLMAAERPNARCGE